MERKSLLRRFSGARAFPYKPTSSRVMEAGHDFSPGSCPHGRRTPGLTDLLDARATAIERVYSTIQKYILALKNSSISN